MKILTYLDMLKNQIKNLVLENISEAPANPVAGQVYFNNSGARKTKQDMGYNHRYVDYAYGNNIFVAVGSSGRVAYSNDGKNWTENTLASGKFYGGVAFGNNKFVAAGASGSIATSSDGITWSEIIPLPSDEHFNTGIAFGSGKFVTVGQSGSIATSSDGITWNISSFGGALNGVVYDGSRFIINKFNNAYATYASSFVVSEDGISWTEITIPSNVKITYIVYGNGAYIGVYSEYNGSSFAVYLVYSQDLVNWTPVDYTFNGSYNITFGNGTFMAFGPEILSSVNGLSWSIFDETSFNASTYESWRFLNGLFIGTIDSRYIGQLEYAINYMAYYNGSKWVKVIESDVDVPTALSQLTDDRTHRLVTDLEKVAWYDKVDSADCLGYPDSNNKVITQHYLGMSLIRKDPTDTLTFTNVNPNTCMLVVPVLGVTSQITVTLNAGGENRAEEWSLIFKAGSGMSLNVSAPGFTIVWKDGIPSFQEGKIYEISFLCLYYRYIIAYVAETDLS